MKIIRSLGPFVYRFRTKDSQSLKTSSTLVGTENYTDFSLISRKAICVVQYKDDTKLHILKEYNDQKGYAVGFQGLIQFLKALLPSKEGITETARKTISDDCFA